VVAEKRITKVVKILAEISARSFGGYKYRFTEEESLSLPLLTMSQRVAFSWHSA
jgi:hypothetical protein